MGTYRGSSHSSKSLPVAAGWTSSPRESVAFGGWIALGEVDSTRRQPSASTTSGACRSPRSVWTTIAPSSPADRPVTVAVSNRASPQDSHSSAQSSR